ncbi:MAG: hypothetical protein M0Z65_07050 [Firmicutes bacterium]|nr:hypothetical protein [Bacillota bacterium]
MKEGSIIATDWDEPAMVDWIAQKTRARSVYVQNQVYYPYLYIQYRLQQTGGLFRKKGRIACTVDLVSGKEAIADTMPVMESRWVPVEKMIQEGVQREEARKRAEAYVYASLSVGLKWLGTPTLILEEEEICYRPFWVMSCEWERADPAKIVVDAVSGRYHPLFT